MQYRDEEHVPSIVTEELWERANRILQSRAEKTQEKQTDTHSRYPYSGKLFCALDGEPYYRGVYRSGGVQKEVWQCRKYCEKGRSGCSSQPVYTAELNEILRDFYRRCVPDSSQWAQSLVQLYETLAEWEKGNGQLPGVRRGITDRVRKKDKLLDLNVNGRLSDEDFEEQNRRLSDELSALRKKEQELTKKARQQDSREQSARLRRQIVRELAFSNGFSAPLVDLMLRRAEISSGEQKGEVRLTLFAQGEESKRDYDIVRRRGKPSVCTALYI